MAYILVKMDEIRTEVSKNFQELAEGGASQAQFRDIEELDFRLNQENEALDSLEVRLCDIRGSLQHFSEKQGQYSLFKQKLHEINKKRKFLEKEINLLVQMAGPEIRCKSVPRGQESRGPGFYTDRLGTEKLLITEASEKPKQGGAFHTEARDCESVERKCRRDCAKHQKKYRFNVETASFREIELFDSVIPLIFA